MTAQRRHVLLWAGFLLAATVWSEFSVLSPWHHWARNTTEEIGLSIRRAMATPPCVGQIATRWRIPAGPLVEHPDCYEQVLPDPAGDGSIALLGDPESSAGWITVITTFVDIRDSQFESLRRRYKEPTIISGWFVFHEHGECGKAYLLGHGVTITIYTECQRYLADTPTEHAHIEAYEQVLHSAAEYSSPGRFFFEALDHEQQDV